MAGQVAPRPGRSPLAQERAQPGERDQITVATFEVLPEAVHAPVLLQPVEEQQVDGGGVDPVHVLAVADHHRHPRVGDEARDAGVRDVERGTRSEVNDPVREAVAQELPELLDLDRVLVEDQLAGSAVAGEVEDAIAAPVPELAEVVLELFLGVAGEVGPPHVVDALGELQHRHHAETVFDVAVPQRLDAGDLLLVAVGPPHQPRRRAAAVPISSRLAAKASTTVFMSGGVSVPMFDTRKAYVRMSPWPA